MSRDLVIRDEASPELRPAEGHVQWLRAKSDRFRAISPQGPTRLQMTRYPAFWGYQVVYFTRDGETLVARREVPVPGEEAHRIVVSSCTVSNETFDAVDELWNAALAHSKRHLTWEPGRDSAIACTDGVSWGFSDAPSHGDYEAQTTNCLLPPLMKALVAIGQRMIDLTLAEDGQRSRLERELREAAEKLVDQFR